MIETTAIAPQRPEGMLRETKSSRGTFGHVSRDEELARDLPIVIRAVVRDALKAQAKREAAAERRAIARAKKLGIDSSDIWL